MDYTFLAEWFLGTSWFTLNSIIFRCILILGEKMRLRLFLLSGMAFLFAACGSGGGGGGTPGTPTMTVASASTSEGDSGTKQLIFPVTLSAAATSPVTVQYATAHGTTDNADYSVISSGTLTINTGSSYAEISVDIIGDTDAEPDETFSLVLSNPSGVVLAANSVTGTIQNDDITAPQLSSLLNISNATVSEGDSGTSTLVFTLSLAQSVTGDVNVNYATGMGTASVGVDYVAASGIATITQGNLSTTINITVNGDADVEQNEIVPVVLSNVSGSAVLMRSVGHGIIQNDDGGMAVALPKTGQQVCFDQGGVSISCTATGQDGEYQQGATEPAPRFVENGDGTITDTLTGLVWPNEGNIMPTRDPSFDTDGTSGDGVVTWQTALNYIAKLNREAYLGYHDWRLPNRNELLSLANFGVTDNGLALTAYGFANYQRSYWTSSSYTSVNPFSAAAWAVNVASGYVLIDDKADVVVAFLYALPVRGGLTTASAAVPATGQTDCFDTVGTAVDCSGTGQDGEYQLGTPWPATRFSVNADTTITDNLTGLAWAPDANVLETRDPTFDTDGVTGDGQVTWQTALDYVAKLNADGYLGHNDWYLPNINEYRSLINIQTIMANYIDSTGWLYDAGFSNVGDIYWTSTSFYVYPDTAWTVHIGSSVISLPFAGDTPAVSKTSRRYLWPVRKP